MVKGFFTRAEDVMARGNLTQAQWERLSAVLPPTTPKGRKRLRRSINGLLWVLRTGAPWRDLPKRYGPWTTVYSRFARWQERGVWAQTLTALQAIADADGQVDWTVNFRAHQHAAGARKAPKKGGLASGNESLGRSRGGLSTKIHLRTDGQGRPLQILLTPGQQHELTVFESLMEAGAVPRPGRCPKQRPHRLVADKGYSSQAARRYLARRGIRCTIPHRCNERGYRHGPFNRDMYRERNRVERCFGLLKQNRRIATRYEKRANHYLAMLLLAACMIWV